MAYTRLNSNNRALLLALMEKIVDCPAEQKAEQAAYEKALPIALAIVEANYPRRDMEILRRYQVAHEDNSIKIQLVDADVKRFTFREADRPWVPDGSSAYNRMYLANERDGRHIEKWRDAKDAFDKALKTKHQDYRNLINSGVTFEQVIEVWPEAAQLFDRIKENLPVAVSPEVLARITADSKKRMERAA